MSFEFSNRIEQLTNKLTQVNKNRDQKLQETKELLLNLQHFIQREIVVTEKRMKKIERKLEKRLRKASQQSQSIDQIYELKQEKVTEVINGWVSEYEEKKEGMLEDLNREEHHFKIKIEQEEHNHQQQIKAVEQKISNQLRILKKQVEKWRNLNIQGHQSIQRQIQSYKHLMIRDVSNSKEIKNRLIEALELKMSRVQQSNQEKFADLQKEAQKRALKISHIFQLLLQIEMYNGIGLQTARGSGTSGYIQSNVSLNQKKTHSREQFLQQLQEKRNAYNAPPRKANQEIVDHQRKREILLQSMKLRAKLQAEGLQPEQVQEKVKKGEQILKKKFQKGELQTSGKDTHVVTQAKERQYNRLSQAFGLESNTKTGSAFDFYKQKEQRLKRQAGKEEKRKKFKCEHQGCQKEYSIREQLLRHLKYKHPKQQE